MKNNKLENLAVTIFLCLYFFFIILDLHIFYNSISTLIKTLIITGYFIVLFIKLSTKKERKYLIIYLGISLLYIVLHDIHVNDFLNETLYFWKMLLNIFTIYTVYKLNINYQKSIKYIKLILWFITLNIIVCDLLKFGYSSYNFEKISYSIIDWFTNKDIYFEDVSCKGLFHLANQIVAVVLLYFPILLNEIKENNKMVDKILCILTIISMLIIGNRLSSIGPLIIIVVSFIIYLLLIIIKKEKINYDFLLTLLIIIITANILLAYSPILKREDFYDKLENNNITEVKNSNQSSKENLPIKIDNPNKNTVNELENKNLNMNFIEVYYPYEKDKNFWDELNKENISFANSRYIERRIIKHISFQEARPLNKYLGIGYNKTINIVNIEQDYIMQFYSIGIIGTIIFLSPYFLCYLYLAFKLLSNLEKRLNFLNLMYLLGVGIFLVSAYFSGNLLNASSTIIPLSFIIGLALNEYNKKIPSEKILGFTVPKLNKKEIIDGLEDDIKNNKQNIIFNLNPLIMYNFHKNQKAVKEFNKEKYNIPDGIGTILALKLKENSGYSQITGVDIVDELLKLSEKSNLKVYLYGSKKHVVEEAKNKIINKYPNVSICGIQDGYINEKNALKDIKKKKPDVLFVALGSPKQENFILNNKNELKNIRIIMPVGGTFDVISGFTKRAPKIYQKTHLEWLYRMIKEPKRIKQNIGLFKFVYLVIFRNSCYNKKGDWKNDKKNRTKFKKI